MPLYDYSCSCGCIAKLITGADEIPNCPECGKKMEREIQRKFFINKVIQENIAYKSSKTRSRSKRI